MTRLSSVLVAGIMLPEKRRAVTHATYLLYQSIVTPRRFVNSEKLSGHFRVLLSLSRPLLCGVRLMVLSLVR